MEVVVISKEIYEAVQRLRESSREVYRLGNHKAETERDYRIALAKEIFTLRYDKMPVSIIGDVARGNVAALKFERDLASDKYRSALSALDSLKVEINALQSVMRNITDL